MRRRRQRRRGISRIQLDYLLQEVFGSRYLPAEIAARIALRAELARGFLGAIEREAAGARTRGRAASMGSPESEDVATVAV